MSNVVFATDRQKEHLEAALSLTGSQGFMEDARAVAAYRPGKDGEPEKLAGVAVFECFRGSRAELHVGLTPGAAMTREILTALVMVAFHPRAFDLERLVARVPHWNVNAICNLLKAGFQFEYRDRFSTVGGEDGIVLSLERDKILEDMAAAGPTHETEPGTSPEAQE